ncbi:cytochrome ubiquinol oxidase subunit I [Isoalcanivorax beigongshangi]|uniref:Cytochrome ubiquinol oxidase subunit I n=1 Tax=Isoalcanivorax beigongshangi TaxID=3238810 RepID=A0ABV4AGB7_9GAMM
MLTVSALDLARVQFGFTISFHIIFPAITIGLASYLVVLEGLWLRRRDPVYHSLYRFWSRIFAVNFAMGVVSGLVMAYQFGTHWSEFSAFAGSITGPLLTYEVLTAFFLEAGFLGVMLFGEKRVGPGLHFFATIMVALGTLMSATWILASNSWMHTPQGFELVDGRVVPVDWLAIIFNPSFPYRLVHMTLAAFLSTALFVAASGAWHQLRNPSAGARRMLSMGLWMLLAVAPLQILVGDLHGLNALKYQPMKVAAMEGHWRNHPGAGVPLVLFAWPDSEAEENRFELAVPRLASLILTHSLGGQIPALTEVPRADRPPVAAVFWSFRVMVGLGLLMLALALVGLLLRRGGGWHRQRWFLRWTLWMGPSGLIAILAGWFTTEIGRQPWVVHGLLRTSDGVSSHSVTTLSISLLVFVAMYAAVFGIGIRYMLRLVAQGPETPLGSGLIPRPARPLSAAPDQLQGDCHGH